MWQCMLCIASIRTLGKHLCDSRWSAETPSAFDTRHTSGSDRREYVLVWRMCVPVFGFLRERLRQHVFRLCLEKHARDKQCECPYVFHTKEEQYRRGGRHVGQTKIGRKVEVRSVQVVRRGNH